MSVVTTAHRCHKCWSEQVALAHSRDLRACLRGEDGRSKVEAWGLLRLLVETKEVNEYHFSLVLKDGCGDVAAVSRLNALISEAGIKPNHVLATGLHAAWVQQHQQHQQWQQQMHAALGYAPPHAAHPHQPVVMMTPQPPAPPVPPAPRLVMQQPCARHVAADDGEGRIAVAPNARALLLG